MIDCLHFLNYGLKFFIFLVILVKRLYGIDSVFVNYLVFKLNVVHI